MDALRGAYDQSPHRPTLLDRPSAPLPPQQVSPLIQASLNARSQVKRASRQAHRPKTFTVLSSSTGQFDRAKARLLTGQEAPPEAQPTPGKRRSHSMHRTSTSGGDDGMPKQPQTIAPKPSYMRKESSLLPTWLREQEYDKNHELDGPSLLETLTTKAEQMDAGSQAAASIDRNTPFFPPHQRDLERATEELQGGGLARYRALNAQTSETSRSRLHSSRSKAALQRKRSEALSSHSQPWGTMLEAGTYAGFRPLTARSDLRLLLPLMEQQHKREFQHHFPPGEPVEPQFSHESQESVHHERPSSTRPESVRSLGVHPDHGHVDEITTEHGTTNDAAAQEATAVRRRSGLFGPRMQPTLPPPETQIFVLQEDVTRPQLPYMPTHVRGASGSSITASKIGAQAPALSVSGEAQTPAHDPVTQAPGSPDRDTPDTTIIRFDDSSVRLNHPLPPLPGT